MGTKGQEALNRGLPLGPRPAAPLLYLTQMSSISGCPQTGLLEADPTFSLGAAP